MKLSHMNRLGLAVAGLVLSLNCSASLDDDVVAVVSVRSPLTSLSKIQIANIFMGKTTFLPGGEQALPIDQTEGGAARDEFYARITGKSAAQIKAYWAKIIFTGRGRPPKAVSNGSEVKKLLAENPSAIGYIEQNMVDDSVRVLTGDQRATIP